MSLARERPEQVLDLALRDRARQRHVQVGLAEIALEFRDLVLEHERVPERLPGKLGDDPMILVPVLEPVSDHEVRRDPLAELVEMFLQLRLVREVAVPEGAHLDPELRAVADESLGARSGFRGSLLVR